MMSVARVESLFFSASSLNERSKSLIVSCKNSLIQLVGSAAFKSRAR